MKSSIQILWIIWKALHSTLYYVLCTTKLIKPQKYIGKVNASDISIYGALHWGMPPSSVLFTYDFRGENGYLFSSSSFFHMKGGKIPNIQSYFFVDPPSVKENL